MRLGEIVTAGVLAILSIYLMWKSTELPVGYIAGEGPGGGAWPFWLSGIMLLSCGMIALNWWRGTSPPSQSDEPMLDGYGWRMLAQQDLCDQQSRQGDEGRRRQGHHGKEPAQIPPMPDPGHQKDNQNPQAKAHRAGHRIGWRDVFEIGQHDDHPETTQT